MDNQFQIQRRSFGHGVILDMSGDLTKQAEETLLGMRAWETGLGSPGSYLILNCTRVPYINSAGIAVLIRLVRAGLKGKFRTFAYGVTPHFQKLFRMVGLTEYLMIYPDEYSVLQRIEDLEQAKM
ncbi:MULTISPECIES: STAS domain-containing protein [Paenibacillus]|jgi:stage II sporulation protein AA (anti-sigma F factor antagonist)|uniref:STAS domain-containing protein n=1 Tax=Paenibacillus oceani TaxID=2772510 RepID=A0A927H056_9BACL|nr:STAS domain-containing protein [Paenibacillus oceani]MBD2863686.1 STAS domain-containing protein [Paenibacillus oceani]MDF2660239.1 anti-anti-sigma factor [Paenibacillus sp.]